MVSQQLTPELMQPNVLVEIDPGPSTELNQEAQQPEPGEPPAQMSDTLNKELDMQFAAFSDDEAELCKAQVAPHISPIGQGNAMLYTPHSLADVDESFDDSIKEPSVLKSSSLWMSPKTSCECGGNTFSIKMQSPKSRKEVLEEGSVPHPECFHNLRQPSWSHGSKSGPTAQDTGKEESIVIGMHRLDGVIEQLDNGGAALSLKANMALRKGLTFHYLTSPGSDVSAFGPPFLRRRSQTKLDDVIDAHKRRMRIRTTLDSIDQTLSASQDESKTSVDKTFPFPDGLRKHSVAMLEEPEKERRVPHPYLVVKRLGDSASHPEGVLQGALFTHAPLRGYTGSVTRPISIARIAGSVSTMDRLHEGAGCRALETPTKHHKVLLKKSVESDGNEKWMAEANESAVVGNLRNHFHHDPPTRDFRSGALRETQSSKKKDAPCVASPSFISWTAGSKKSFEVEPEEIAREVLMWMIEYNLVS